MHEFPECRAVIHFDKVRGFMRRHIIEYLRRREYQTPGKRKIPRRRARSPAAFLIPNADPARLTTKCNCMHGGGIGQGGSCGGLQPIAKTPGKMLGSTGNAYDPVGASDQSACIGQALNDVRLSAIGYFGPVGKLNRRSPASQALDNPSGVFQHEFPRNLRVDMGGRRQGHRAWLWIDAQADPPCACRRAKGHINPLLTDLDYARISLRFHPFPTNPKSVMILVMKHTERPPFHLAFPVHDLHVARTFYGTVLGCPEGRSSDEWVDFDLYGHQIVAHLAPDEAGVESVTNRVDGVHVPVRHFGLVLDWKAWESVAERLSRADVVFIVPPTVRFAGKPGEQASLFVRDPSGNALEFKAFRDPEQLFVG